MGVLTSKLLAGGRRGAGASKKFSPSPLAPLFRPPPLANEQLLEWSLDSSSSSSQHLFDMSALRPSSLEFSSGSPHYSELIDNSTRQYRSVRLACGVNLQVGENVVESCPGILEDLNHDLTGCLLVLPSSVRRLVRRTIIWVNRR
jgi:hypothetical protein